MRKILGLVLVLAFAFEASAPVNFSGKYTLSGLYTFSAAAGGGGGPAVEIDSKFEKGANTQASPFSFVSNAGTVAGSVGANANRVLIAYVCFRNITSSAVSVTWNGTSMTAIGSKLTVNSLYDLYIFGLIAPATGANTIQASWTGGTADSVALGAISVYNADQSTGWQNNGTDTGTCTGSSCASSVITTANGNFAIACHADDNASSLTLDNGVEAWKETALNGNYGMAYKKSTGSSETIAWGLGSSQAWGHQKVDVIKAP